MGVRQQSGQFNATKPAYSPLKLIYFKGCKRSSPGEYRRMFSEIGIQTRTVRDITFLTEDIVQLTVYESAIEDISCKIEAIDESVKRIKDFNPCHGESYKEYGNLSDEKAKAAYSGLMKKSAERIEKASESLKPLKRTAACLNKLVRDEVTQLETTARRPRAFVLGDFFELPAEPEMIIDESQ